jgi:spermidine/putrescine transport system ATP-binding protein
MSVRENIGYGLRMRRVPTAERASQVTQALQMVQLAELGDRSPRQLSGGQQQRVALARALVNRPRVLLLDEPLGALDLKLRKGMQLELKRLQSQLGITFVYVTHDQEEALTMSDRIALMRQGRIEQLGNPRDLYDRPQSRYVADFIGETNLLPGTVVEGTTGQVSLLIGNVRLQGICDEPLAPGTEAWLSVRPEVIRVTDPQSTESAAADGHAADGHNVLNATIRELVYAGSSIRLHALLSGGQRLVAHAPAGSTFQLGAGVRLTWPIERGRCVR